MDEINNLPELMKLISGGFMIIMCILIPSYSHYIRDLLTELCGVLCLTDTTQGPLPVLVRYLRLPKVNKYFYSANNFSLYYFLLKLG
jgi:hypothetical protein